MAEMFSRLGSPALLSIRKKLESVIDTALTDYLKNIKKTTNYPINNTYKYKVKTTPTKVGIYQDEVLTVFLQTDLYSYSTLLSSTSAADAKTHSKMSNSSASLLEYEVDQNVVEAAINEFVNTQATSLKKYDNTDFGKVFQHSYGDDTYYVLHDIFQMDSSDYLDKSNEFKIGVQIVKDSAEVSMTNGTMKFKTEISMWKPNGYSLRHPRKFSVDLIASMTPVMQDSVLTAELKNIKATGIQLIGDSSQEISLSDDQKTQYLSYAQMFLQMKKSSLAKHLQDMKYDLASFNPLSQLHATISDKNYAVKVVDGVLNFDITSDSFPAP